MRSKQRRQGWITGGIAPAPIVQNTGCVRVGLQINAVDYEHLLMVFFSEPSIVGKGCKLDAAIAHWVQRIRPSRDRAFARLVHLGVAIAGYIPTPFSMNLQQERSLMAAVDNGAGQRGVTQSRDDAQARHCLQ